MHSRTSSVFPWVFYNVQEAEKKIFKLFLRKYISLCGGDVFRQHLFPEFFHLHFCCVYVLCFNASSPTLDISKWSKRYFYETYAVKQIKVKTWYTIFIYILVHKEQSRISRTLTSETFRNIDSVLMATQRPISVFHDYEEISASPNKYIMVRNWATSLFLFFFFNNIVILEISPFMDL